MPTPTRAVIQLAVTAHCLGCAWTAGPGDWRVDRAAEKHTKAGHATVTMATPAAKTKTPRHGDEAFLMQASGRGAEAQSLARST